MRGCSCSGCCSGCVAASSSACVFAAAIASASASASASPSGVRTGIIHTRAALSFRFPNAYVLPYSSNTTFFLRPLNRSPSSLSNGSRTLLICVATPSSAPASAMRRRSLSWLRSAWTRRRREVGSAAPRARERPSGFFHARRGGGRAVLAAGGKGRRWTARRAWEAD